MMRAAEMKAGHTEEYVDGTSAAPWPQLDGVRPKTSPALVDDVGRSEDGEGRGGAKYDKCSEYLGNRYTNWFQRTTNRKRHMGYQINGNVADDVT